MSAPGGRTLVGELGREIVVDVDTGRWYTVGNNGPEFVNLPRHAIVFNHTKTAELLGDKMLDMRGVSMASGTKGNSSVGGGMINLDAFTETQKEESKKTRQTVEEVAETLEDKLDAIKEEIRRLKAEQETAGQPEAEKKQPEAVEEEKKETDHV